MKKIFCFLIIFGIFLSPAQAAIVGFANNSLWFSAPTTTLEGGLVKIYTNIVNGDLGRFEGDLVFYANEEVIANSIHFNIAPDESRLFSVVWPAAAGDFKFTARIVNDAIYNEKNERQDVVINRYLSSNQELLSVDKDTDRDGLGDQAEMTAGTDPNRADTDGDGYNDYEDPSPLNSHIFPGIDTDGDGISDKVDTDLDNDGLYNWEEEKLGTNPYKRDTDGDGVFDKEDAFPLDPQKWLKEKLVVLDTEIVTTSDNQALKQTEITNNHQEETALNNIDQLNTSVIPIVSGLASDLENLETNQTGLQPSGEINLNDTKNTDIGVQKIKKEFFINQKDIQGLIKNPLIAFPLGLLVLSLLAGIISFILLLRAKRQENRNKINAKY